MKHDADDACPSLAVLAGDAAALAASPGRRADKIKVVATFSIIGDLVRNVGGDRVEVSDAGRAEQRCARFLADSRRRQEARRRQGRVRQRLGLEGWITRLVKAPAPRRRPSLRAQASSRARRRTITARPSSRHRSARLAVGRQREDLRRQYPRRAEQGRPGGQAAAYDANANAYLDKLDALEQEVRAAIEKIPADPAESSPPTTRSVISAPPTALSSSAPGVRRMPSRRPRTSPKSSPR